MQGRRWRRQLCLDLERCGGVVRECVGWGHSQQRHRGGLRSVCVAGQALRLKSLGDASLANQYFLDRQRDWVRRGRGGAGAAKQCDFLRVHKHTSSLKMASIGIPCTPTAADKAERVSASEGP